MTARNPSPRTSCPVPLLRERCPVSGLSERSCALEQPGTNPLKDAHAALDAAVLAAYGFLPVRDLLAQLFALNQELAARHAQGEAVTAPSLPTTLSAAGRAALITDDCIRPS